MDEQRHYSKPGITEVVWDNEETGENGFSEVADLRGMSHFAIMGQVDDNTDIKVWIAPSDNGFYFSQEITDEITLEEIPDVPAWEADVNYKTGDLVEHEVEGALNVYEALRNHKSTNNNQPPDENTWELVFEDIEGDYPQVLHVHDTSAARYMQLQSTNNVTATAIITAKP